MSPQIWIGASSSRSAGCEISTFFASVMMNSISSVDSCTVLPGFLSRCEGGAQRMSAAQFLEARGGTKFWRRAVEGLWRRGGKVVKAEAARTAARSFSMMLSMRSVPAVSGIARTACERAEREGAGQEEGGDVVGGTVAISSARRRRRRTEWQPA